MDLQNNSQKNNYSKTPVENQPIDEKSKKEHDKTKKELEKLKNFAIKKFKFISAMGILPPQSIPKWIEEDEAPQESKEMVHLAIIVQDEKVKEIPKIKEELVKEIQKSKEKIWLHVFPVSEIWEIAMDQKFDLSAAIGMAYPLYDTGILGALRVAEIHKSLVVQKFEKYVVSYCIGGSLVRGDATDASDVDVFVIINDTDVKRMPRRELLERLRGIIYQYVAEANQIAGVKNKLEPQIYLLTDFWDSVKDASPVMFTFIRDGVPLYDRGTFMPWKALLRMGKLKPSPEAIDMFMSMGDGVIPRSKRTLLSDIFTNIFWGVTTPAQALLMLNGCPPPNAKKELVRDFKKEFLNTKMIEKKYIDFLEKIIDTWRDYEHEKIKEISGKEIDKLLKGTEEYLERLKELRKEIEKKSQVENIEKIYKDTMALMKKIIGNKAQDKLIKEFEEDYVKKGKFSNQHLRAIRNILKARDEVKKGKSSVHKVDRARRDSDLLMRDLIEYTQRRDFDSVEKAKMKIKVNDKEIQVLNIDGTTFLFESDGLKKITDKIEEATMDEVNNCISKQKDMEDVQIDSKVFDILKKRYGKFEIIF